MMLFSTKGIRLDRLWIVNKKKESRYCDCLIIVESSLKKRGGGHLLLNISLCFNVSIFDLNVMLTTF